MATGRAYYLRRLDEGIATAAGCQLVATCELTIASERIAAFEEKLAPFWKGD